MYSLYTNETNDFNFYSIISEGTQFEFALQACEEAYVILSSHPGEAESTSYEIRIGSDANQKCSIRKTGPNATETHEFSTQDVLDCEWYRHFVVEWASGNFKLYEKDFTEKLLVDWSDGNPYQVNAVHIGTRHEDTANWKLGRDEGVIFSLGGLSLTFSSFSAQCKCHNH